MVACVQWRAGSEQQVVATGWWWTVDSCEVVFQVGRCRGGGRQRVLGSQRGRVRCVVRGQ